MTRDQTSSGVWLNSASFRVKKYVIVGNLETLESLVTAYAQDFCSDCFSCGGCIVVDARESTANAANINRSLRVNSSSPL